MEQQKLPYTFVLIFYLLLYIDQEWSDDDSVAEEKHAESDDRQAGQADASDAPNDPRSA
jgi:hypothetical protein